MYLNIVDLRFFQGIFKPSTAQMQHPIIMACGLPGTGKTTSTAYLEERLENYDRHSPIEIRRELGYKIFSTPQILGNNLVAVYMQNRLHDSLYLGKGAILEANFKTRNGRQGIYDIAAAWGLEVLVLEHYCSEFEAKRRMRQRPKNDGLVMPSRNPKIYDKVKSIWEDTPLDLENPNVSLVRYNTEQNLFQDIRINPSVVDFVALVKALLVENSQRIPGNGHAKA